MIRFQPFISHVFLSLSLQAVPNRRHFRYHTVSVATSGQWRYGSVIETATDTTAIAMNWYVSVSVTVTGTEVISVTTTPSKCCPAWLAFSQLNFNTNFQFFPSQQLLDDDSLCLVHWRVGPGTVVPPLGWLALGQLHLWVRLRTWFGFVTEQRRGWPQTVPMGLIALATPRLEPERLRLQEQSSGLIRAKVGSLTHFIRRRNSNDFMRFILSFSVCSVSI